MYPMVCKLLRRCPTAAASSFTRIPGINAIAAAAAAAAAVTAVPVALAEEEEDEAANKFAGGEQVGGGRFEDPELRDIAANVDGLMTALVNECGLAKGNATSQHRFKIEPYHLQGMMTDMLVRSPANYAFIIAEGGSAGVINSKRRSRFGRNSYLRRANSPREFVTYVVVAQPDDKAPFFDVGTVDVAICIDVYHHLVDPKTFSKSVLAALKPGGKYVVIDFHRDPAIFVNSDAGHQGSCVLDHVRAGKAVVLAEIEAAGFVLVDEPVIPGMRGMVVDNYCLVFQKK